MDNLPHPYISYMHKHFLIIILISTLCGGCAAPTRLGERDIRTIQGISLAIDTTLLHDVSGSTDAIDLPASMAITNKLLKLATEMLTAKGFHIEGHHRSVGMAEPSKYYYVMATEKDRKRDPSQLQRRTGPFYSDRLSSAQLTDLYKRIANVHFASNPAVARMGFAGDTTLIIQVRGRTIGSDKRIATTLGNILLIPVNIYTTIEGGMPTGFLMDTDNAYYVYIRMYRTRDGEILWQRDFKSNSVKEMLKTTAENLQDRIPAKPGMAGH